MLDPDKTDIEVYDDLSPELRSLVREYGLAKVYEIIHRLKVTEPVAVERILIKDRRYMQTKVEQENADLGERLNNIFKKGFKNSG